MVTVSYTILGSRLKSGTDKGHSVLQAIIALSYLDLQLLTGSQLVTL